MFQDVAVGGLSGAFVVMETGLVELIIKVKHNRLSLSLFDLPVFFFLVKTSHMIRLGVTAFPVLSEERQSGVGSNFFY